MVKGVRRDASSGTLNDLLRDTLTTTTEAKTYNSDAFWFSPDKWRRLLICRIGFNAHIYLVTLGIEFICVLDKTMLVNECPH